MINYIGLFHEVCQRILDASYVIVQLGYLFVKIAIFDPEILISLAEAATLQHRHFSFSNSLSKMKQNFFEIMLLYLYLPPNSIQRRRSGKIRAVPLHLFRTYMAGCRVTFIFTFLILFSTSLYCKRRISGTLMHFICISYILQDQIVFPKLKQIFFEIKLVYIYLPPKHIYRRG